MNPKKDYSHIISGYKNELRLNNKATLSAYCRSIGVSFSAVRQYDRWLRDNYADLEHKEVWNIVGVVTAFILCAFSYIVSDVFIES